MYYIGITRNLNGNNYSITTVILIHELLHILGVYSINSIYNIPDPDDPFKRRLWTGPDGVAGYRKVLANNGFESISHLIEFIPLEDDGNRGTIHVHSEENEIYYKNDVPYPALQNEIMTGNLDQSNYITPLTTGVLSDLGFIINNNSNYIIF